MKESPRNYKLSTDLANSSRWNGIDQNDFEDTVPQGTDTIIDDTPEQPEYQPTLPGPIMQEERFSGESPDAFPVLDDVLEVGKGVRKGNVHVLQRPLPPEVPATRDSWSPGEIQRYKRFLEIHFNLEGVQLDRRGKFLVGTGQDKKRKYFSKAELEQLTKNPVWSETVREGRGENDSRTTPNNQEASFQSSIIADSEFLARALTQSGYGRTTLRPDGLYDVELPGGNTATMPKIEVRRLLGIATPVGGVDRKGEFNIRERNPVPKNPLQKYEDFWNSVIPTLEKFYEYKVAPDKKRVTLQRFDTQNGKRTVRGGEFDIAYTDVPKLLKILAEVDFLKKREQIQSLGRSDKHNEPPTSSGKEDFVDTNPDTGDIELTRDPRLSPNSLEYLKEILQGGGGVATLLETNMKKVITELDPDAEISSDSVRIHITPSRTTRFTRNQFVDYLKRLMFSSPALARVRELAQGKHREGDQNSDRSFSMERHRTIADALTLSGYGKAKALDDGLFEVVLASTGGTVRIAESNAIEIIEKLSQRASGTQEDPPHSALGIDDSATFNDSFFDSTINDLYNEATELPETKISNSGEVKTASRDKNGELAVKANQAAVARLQHLKEEEEGGGTGVVEILGTSPSSSKRHLNNAESIAYLKQVAAERKTHDEKLKENARQAGLLGATELEKKQNSQNEQADAKLISSYEAALRRFEARSQQSEISAGTNPEALTTPPVTEQTQARTRDDIEREIRELTEANARGEYNHRGFIEKYKLKEKFEAGGSARDAATYVWIQNRIAALKAERASLQNAGSRQAENRRTENADIVPRVHDATLDARYEKEFGISSEELDRIPGFSKLSVGQQGLILRNLHEYAWQGAHGVLPRVWNGLKKSVFGIEGNGVPPVGSKGMRYYGSVLAKMAAEMAEYGPRVFVTPEGDFEPALIDNIRFDRKHRREEYEAVRRVNHTAYELARMRRGILSGTSLSTGGRKEGITLFPGIKKLFRSNFILGVKETFGSERALAGDRYDDLQKKYESDKRHLSQVLEAAGWSDNKIDAVIAQLDSHVNGSPYNDRQK